MSAEAEVEHLQYALQQLRAAYAAAMETAWHNYEQAELNLQAACGWAWDFGAHWVQNARCYWCGEVLTGGRDGVAAHTQQCEKNPVVALMRAKVEEAVRETVEACAVEVRTRIESGGITDGDVRRIDPAAIVARVLGGET